MSKRAKDKSGQIPLRLMMLQRCSLCIKFLYMSFFLWLHPGRAPPRNTTVDLNSGNIDVPPNMTSWPSFHNGVAAGLKIAPASQVCLKQHQLYYLLSMSYS